MSRLGPLSIASGLSAIALVPACATIPRVPAQMENGTELISLETSPGPFCGRCDSVKITALSDGRVWIEQGHWAGDYTDWRTTKRFETVSVEAFSRFRAALQAYRPHGKAIFVDQRNCTVLMADLDQIDVKWRDMESEDQLVFNFGCDPQSRHAIADALRNAPGELGILRLEMPWAH
jgi:hypothetical protein